MWDKTNGPIRRTALILGAADGTSEITISNVGGVLYATYPSGTVAPLGGGARSVQVLVADLVVTGSLAAYVYANGTAGVGATLTANANGVFGAQDSVTSAAGYTYLVPPSAVSDPKYAGLYTLNPRGTVGTKAVLTRTAEFDSPEDMKDGTLFEIRLGTLYGNKGPWQLTGDVAAVGTDAVTITRAPNLMLLDTAQTVTGAKTFADTALLLRNTADTFSTTVKASAATAARVVTLPDAAGEILLDGATQTVTGAKTFAANALKQANGAGTFSHLFASAASADRTVTLPDAAGTFAVSASSPITLSAGGDIGASTAAVTNGGAGNTGKILVLDGAGKLSGRVVETDGATLDALAAGAAADVSLVTITIAAGDVAALNGTPKQVIAAPAAGKYIEIVSAHVWLDFATTAYDGVVAGEDLTLTYNGGADDLITPITGTGFGDAVADAHRAAKGSATFTPTAATAVMATIKVGEWFAVAGDSPLKFEILYRVRDLAW